MISSEELLELIKNLESDRIERTISIKNTDKFCEAICAFSNDLADNKKPGYLCIGVTDEGLLSGLQATDDLLLMLSDIRSSGRIGPLPVMNVQTFTYDAGNIVVVEVFPSDNPPVSFKGRICVRVGPQRGFASAQEERRLSEKRSRSVRNYDGMPLRESSIDDLAFDLFIAYRRIAVPNDVIEMNGRTEKEQLSALHFFDLKEDCPTVAGILMFGKNPRYFLPGAYIQYLVFPGTSATDLPIDQAEISGDLVSCLRELETRIKVNIKTSLTESGLLKHESTQSYPEVALRELINNAIMHRNYDSFTPVRLYFFSDHLEIQSPGNLFGEVTIQTLTKASSYRNPIIADTMKTLDFVNKFGFGIQRAQKALENNGNPPAEFESLNDTFQAKILSNA